MDYHKPSEHQREALLTKEKILYRLARLARNTDGIHPSSLGPMIGECLLELRLIDGEKYNRECIQPKCSEVLV